MRGLSAPGSRAWKGLMTETHREPEAQDALPVGMYTETLARLYSRQGYAEEALRIYRHLSAEHPDDAHLQDQIRVLTEQVASMSEPPPLRSRGGGGRAVVSPESAVGEAVLDPVIAELERWLAYLQRRHLPR